MPCIPFNENFNTNRMNWLISDQNEIRCTIQDREYVIEHRQLSSYWVNCINLHDIGLFEGCQIHATMRVDFCCEQSRYGVVWGLVDTDNFNVFLVTGFGDYYTVGKFFNGNWHSFLPWTTCPVSMNRYSPNTLSVQKQGRSLELLINSMKVANLLTETDSNETKIGFYVEGPVKIAVLELIVDRASTREKSAQSDSSKKNWDAEDYAPDIHFLSNGRVTTDYEEWHEDYETGGKYSDPDYWITHSDD